MHNPSKSVSVALGAMLAGSLLTGVMMSLPQGLRSDIYADQLTRSQEARENLSTADSLSSAFRNVAEVLKPSVVSISTSQTVTIGGRRGGLPPEFRRGLPPGFEDFFGDFGDFGRGGPQQQQQQQRSGMGSGVIVSEDGYVLTNNHVVEGSDQVTVELSDGRNLEAEVVGTDPQTDLAVLKVDANGLVPVQLGNSDDIRVGDWVLAVGSPFGLEQTVTAGIISGKNRVQGIVGGGQGFEDFLQTDAAINPGNSGGPLVNLRGELVGINTAIVSRSGGNAGIGFAIPVTMAKPVMEQIIDGGEVRRGFIGAGLKAMTPEVAKEMGIDSQTGAMIDTILDNQPAAKAGLQPGDVVTKVDGKDVRNDAQLRNYIASRTPGTAVQMQVRRGDETLNLTVNLAERTDEVMAQFNGGSSALGAELVPLTPEKAKEYGYPEDQKGLVVMEVRDDSPASQIGLLAGDILESVNGQPLTAVSELNAAITAFEKDRQPLRLNVRRGNRTQMLLLR